MPATPSDVEEFVARHWALASRVIGARARWVRDVDRDDTRSDGLLALFEAARTFDPDRGEEAPHVVRTITWRLIDGHRDRHGRADRGALRTRPLHLGEHATDTLPASGDLILERLNAIAVRQVLDALPAKHRDVLTGYYLEGRTLAALGNARGLTEARASQLVDDALVAAARIASRPARPVSVRPAVPCGSACPLGHEAAPVALAQVTSRCAWCDDPISDVASYCSSPCRQAAYRARRKTRTTKHAPHLPAQRSRWGASCVQGWGVLRGTRSGCSHRMPFFTSQAQPRRARSSLH